MATLTIAPPEPQEQTPAAPSGSPATNVRAERIAQIIALTALLAFPAVMCLRGAAVADNDIWWHMRVGELILQHHAIPHVESFSRELTGTPWLAYSWLFELLTIKLFRAFGLVGMVGYSATMVLAVTVSLRHMVQRLQPDFTVSALIVSLSCFSFAHLYTPRPWLFSILFFALELGILMHARRTGRLRELLWLPVIFALWVNIHIEFIYGFFIAGLAFVESFVATRRRENSPHVPLLPIGAALLACALATLVNPFGWRLYTVVYNLVTQGGGLNVVSEMQAIPFRTLTDYSILLLALASAGALAWKRQFRIFEWGVLLFAIVMSFRSQRDAYLVSVTAAAILAAALPGRKTEMRLPRFGSAFAALAAACIVLLGFRVFKVNNQVLQSQVTHTLPAAAVDVVRKNGYPGPVFNDFNWGGYLIWALRQPVTIDGRTNLYGNARMDRSIQTWNAQPDWASDPMLTSAGVVIGGIESPLTQLLRLDSHFRLVYEDKVAAVFIAQKGR